MVPNQQSVRSSKRSCTMYPIDVFRSTLSKIVGIFAEHGIRYHLTGGLTSMAYGEPRMTQDIDIVVDPKNMHALRGVFLASLSSRRFLFDGSLIERAIENRGMFQLLDIDESLKLDIYVRELIPGELDRSVELELFDGFNVPIASRVDAAASKLVWIDKGSHKSRRDFRQIYRNASAGEQQSIEQLCRRLNLGSLFQQVLDESDEIDLT